MTGPAVARGIGGRSSNLTPAPKNVLREVLLTVGAVCGLLCIGSALAAAIFGITPLVFRSGSMSPEIDTGALAFAKSTPATELEVADVVSVTNASGERVTHRIETIEVVTGNSATLVLRGDANADVDSEPYVVSEADRILFSVNRLGYVVTWLSGPVAVFGGGVLVGVLLMVAWRPGGAQAKSRVELGEAPHGRHATRPGLEEVNDEPAQ
ncbi:signal peptidase I [Rhodococcus sp. H36-A4]|uniref:signal peptidase I n=1 Tax=Rhodococcus sp. H36-A4 TaxID=3004353 RepID=UPI0022AEB730|nr:signal peptidase I [Rhodococcus sp. H36-A4]MCZ4080476.1 signal peptidase I [Rhodococcus sp. H36-A4]